jgi:hypothetical protein
MITVFHVIQSIETVETDIHGFSTATYIASLDTREDQEYELQRRILYLN